MRESEDHVEFKKGEHGNVSYNGAGKDKPQERRRCILGYVAPSVMRAVDVSS